MENPLLYPLFSDDFGEPSDYVLADKMVKAAKSHVCSNCYGPIAVGEKHRHHVGLYGGHSPYHYRYCAQCCVAMANMDTEELERRHEEGGA